jgi:2-polyprenyl-3-methyl-5-hydroxy-6-metoxy-1,4-benzoquinol methylase/uncharacterized protein (DUF2062 family)
LARFSLFREEVRRAWRELRGGETSPARAAAAVALGLFVGSQPIFGCHTPIVLFLCVWFRLDAALCWVASNISNPFFAPFLLTAEATTGHYVRTGEIVRFDVEVTRASGLAGIAGDTFLGAPFIGLGLAIAGSAVVYGSLVLKRALFPAAAGRKVKPYVLPENAPPWIKAVERVAGRYAPPADSTPAQRTRFHYVRVKLVTDPVARLIADIAGETPGVLGEVLDVGTGRGQLPILLVELGRATRGRGIDWDQAKIEDAKLAAATSPAIDAEFEQGDARTAELGTADTLLLIDLVHYFTVEEQDELLRRAAKAVRPGGRIIVREADTERGWRSTMTLLEERVFTALRFNRGERVRFRAAREIVEILEADGIRCETRPAWGKTPFSNVIIIGERSCDSAPAP